jgi:low temperature requirement protein LtrA
MTWPELIHPPRLQHSDTQTGQQRNASRLELFFDLAFVLVVAELAVELRNNLTLHGVLVVAGLFTSVWWAWAGFTIYANRFDTDDIVYRLAKLVAMLAVVGLAASTTEATGSLATQFALCQATLHLILVALYVRAARHVVQARSLIAVYLVAEGLAAMLWLIGAVLPAPVRYACWAVAVAAEAAAPILATMRSAGLPSTSNTSQNASGCSSSWCSANRSPPSPSVSTRATGRWPRSPSPSSDSSSQQACGGSTST